MNAATPDPRNNTPIRLSHWVTRRAFHIWELPRDFGVRRNTPFLWIKPWMQASVTAQPRLKKLYMERKATRGDRFRAFRSTHRKRQKCRKRKTAGMMSRGPVNGRTEKTP